MNNSKQVQIEYILLLKNKILWFVLLYEIFLYRSTNNEKPILYGDEVSPPVRFVMMTASALNIDIKFHEIDLFKNEHRQEFYRKVRVIIKIY